MPFGKKCRCAGIGTGGPGNEDREDECGSESSRMLQPEKEQCGDRRPVIGSIFRIRGLHYYQSVVVQVLRRFE
jgi:hypothetical protein